MSEVYYKKKFEDQVWKNRKLEDEMKQTQKVRIRSKKKDHFIVALLVALNAIVALIAGNYPTVLANIIFIYIYAWFAYQKHKLNLEKVRGEL